MMCLLLNVISCTHAFSGSVEIAYALIFHGMEKCICSRCVNSAIYAMAENHHDAPADW